MGYVDHAVDITTGLVGGFCAGTRLETPEGWRDVASLTPGCRLSVAGLGDLPVLGMVERPATAAWIGLPAPDGAQPLFVSEDQILRCRHFLCSALFGRPVAHFSAGDLRGPGVIASDGILRSCHIPILEPAARRASAVGLRIHGYEFACVLPGSEAQPVAGGAAQPQPLLTPQEVEQLCQSGILFRQAVSR